jgi:tetratricopeptide (TPR) repeat protein
MPQTSPDQRFPTEMQRPVFFSGKVVLDDGTPPPESVVIVKVCGGGNPRPQAYTDSKGHFSFQLGQPNAMMPDASMSSSSEGIYGNPNAAGRNGNFGGNRGFGERDLMGCELRADLPGYRSEIVNLSGRRTFDNPDVGTIVLHRLGNVEGTTISATTLQAPKDARKAYDKGRNALGKKKVEEAQKEFQKAVDVYPKYASAWFELGRIHEQQNQFDQARESYSKALEADSKYISPYLQLALISARESKWQEVVDTTDRVLKLDAFDFPQAFFYNSVANFNLGKLDAAEKSAREAQKLDANHRFPKVDQLLGMILAQKRDYTGAAEQMRNYLKFAPEAQDADKIRSQLAELEKMSDAAANGNQKPQ